MGTLSVAFVDDHPILLDGLVNLFSMQERFVVVAQGKTADDAVEITGRCGPDVMFVDLSMPGDVYGAIRHITSNSKTTKALVLTAFCGVDAAVKAFDAGASAFVLKGSTMLELIGAIDTVMRGDIFVSQELAGKVLTEMRAKGDSGSTRQTIRLSVREKQIIGQLLKARTNREIAVQLAISEKTVKHYMTNLMSKLNARNRVEVVTMAQQQGALN